MLSETDQTIIADFQDLYLRAIPNNALVLRQTRWMNVPCFKLPSDLWIYQEIIHEVKPDLIIETGTFLGGSTLFMAHMLDIIGKGQIISIDIQKLPRPSHPRIQYVTGSSSDAGFIQEILADDRSEKRMVILDSDHHKLHVLQEMNLLSNYVTLGSYLIVEDTNMSQYPSHSDFGAGPDEAITEFLETNAEFVQDHSREKFLMSFNKNGYLKRIGL